MVFIAIFISILAGKSRLQRNWKRLKKMSHWSIFPIEFFESNELDDISLKGNF